MQTKYGYLLSDWEKAKCEMIEILIKLAPANVPGFESDDCEPIHRKYVAGTTRIWPVR